MLSYIITFLVVPFIIGLVLNRKLGMRLSGDRKITGAAAGVAEYFKVDATIVRIVTAIVIIFTFVTVPSYFAFALGLSKQ